MKSTCNRFDYVKSNFIDVPTDCPTRERAGWTGDVNVFAETACYLADTRKFLKKWLNDFLSLQKSDGSLPFIVPEIPLETEHLPNQRKGANQKVTPKRPLHRKRLMQSLASV